MCCPGDVHRAVRTLLCSREPETQAWDSWLADVDRTNDFILMAVNHCYNRFEKLERARFLVFLSASENLDTDNRPHMY